MVSTVSYLDAKVGVDEDATDAHSTEPHECQWSDLDREDEITKCHSPKPKRKGREDGPGGGQPQLSGDVPKPV